MDLILVKPRAYRHFLYNLPFLLPHPEDEVQPEDTRAYPPGSTGEDWATVVRRFLALSLVDAYIRWFYLCAHPALEADSTGQRERDYTTSWDFGSTVRFSLPYLARHAVLSTARAPLAREDATIMLHSYITVWLATAAETLALHSVVTLLSVIATYWARRRRADSATKPSSRQREGQSDSPDLADLAPAQTQASHPISEDPVTRGPRSSVHSDGDDAEDAISDQWAMGTAASAPADLELMDLYRPQLVPHALLLSSLPTLVLLAIVLLWESKMPRSAAGNLSADPSRLGHLTHALAAQQKSDPLVLGHLFPSVILRWVGISSDQSLEDLLGASSVFFSTDFAVRTLLGGLSAGVCLAVIHPRQPVLTTTLLLAGWSAAFGVRALWTGMPAHTGPSSDDATADAGRVWLWARRAYCDSLRPT
ncbi:unnamed protein product [Parajaminaea phylloscopi]